MQSNQSYVLGAKYENKHKSGKLMEMKRIIMRSKDTCIQNVFKIIRNKGIIRK